MLKEKFGQPESKEDVAEINEADLSQEERDKLIEAAEERLRALMDRAHATATIARHNRFISKSDYNRLLEFFQKIGGEIANADIESADINEILKKLNTIADRLKLPGDIEKENAELLLERMEELAERGKGAASLPKTGNLPGIKKEPSARNGGVKFYLRRRKNINNQREEQRRN